MEDLATQKYRLIKHQQWYCDAAMGMYWRTATAEEAADRFAVHHITIRKWWKDYHNEAYNGIPSWFRRVSIKVRRYEYLP